VGVFVRKHVKAVHVDLLKDAKNALFLQQPSEWHGQTKSYIYDSPIMKFQKLNTNAQVPRQSVLLAREIKWPSSYLARHLPREA
jgi:hypothetical protein